MALRFTPLQSFVESSFFTELSDRKLNDYKLDSAPRPISGFMTSPLHLNKFNDKPIINLDYTSFEEPEDSETTNAVAGELLNVNTIEEFKSFDKLSSLKSWGEVLRKEMEQSDKGFTEKFYLLAFADLKKYKYYYWLAFPLLHSRWSLVESTNNNEYELQIEEYLKKKPSTFLSVHGDEIVAFNSSLDSSVFVYVDTCLNPDNWPSVQLSNWLYYLALKGHKCIKLLVYRNNGSSQTLKLALDEGFDIKEAPKVTGWERTVQGKLGPKLADLGSLINPSQLAEQAVDLNLRLMKWRVAPQLDLDIIKEQKVLLLGAGTLGSYVARALLGWGIRNVTFVDNGRVSYSNPVRQPLFAFKDCFSDGRQGAPKAERASAALKEIYPSVSSKGYNMTVPMIGHPVTEGSNMEENYNKLDELFGEHDVIFLLMDSRESRWLPTVMGLAHDKIVINAALGFDSYLVMRHASLSTENRLGCYYCNDVVAPSDSLSDRTLDQMCTVTRPGGALMASSIAVELLVSILQNPKKQHAPAGDSTKFGEVPHQIRGNLNTFHQSKLWAPAYKHCSACSKAVVEGYNGEKWEFVKRCLNDKSYLEEISGLRQVQEEAEKALEEFDFEDEVDDF
ncbi:E1-like protein-activating enzyme Gsa7p/Apg7p [Candidozyma auris]|nr:E1-like protein-activating enzyme Gsa7p/Apg7p [[Candida] auris]